MTSQVVNLQVTASIPIDCDFWSEDDGWKGLCKSPSVTVRGSSFEDAKKNMATELQAHIERILREHSKRSARRIAWARRATFLGPFFSHETNMTSVAAAKRKHNFERVRTYFKLRPALPAMSGSRRDLPPAQAWFWTYRRQYGSGELRPGTLLGCPITGGSSALSAKSSSNYYS